MILCDDFMKSARYHLKKQGFINLGCLGLAITIALLWGGGQGIYTALKNREPLKMTFREYEEKRPTAEWVSLSDAQLNLLNSAYVTSRFSDEIKEVYIAVEAVGDRSEKAALVLLASKDKELIDMMNSSSIQMNALKSPGDMTPELLKSLFPTRVVTGLVRFGIDADSKTRDKLAKLDLSLAKDFIIINDGEEPKLGVSVGMLIGGLVLGFFILSRSSRETPPPSPPPLPAMP